MLWVHKITGEIYEMRVIAMGKDHFRHDGFNSYEIGRVCFMGNDEPDYVENLEFLGWL